jgi:hypothetical protein
VQLQWSKKSDGTWWQFDRVHTRELNSLGVFVCWRNGSGVKMSAVLYVGRGLLRDEFAKCWRDPLFRSEGVYVTWAPVGDANMLDAIAAYLYRELRPIWGEVPPIVPPIPVNLPIWA